jgi:hypothetical protein
VLNSTEPFIVVRCADPAIDHSDESTTDWARFYDDRDPKRLSYLPGLRPVEYHCRPLSQSERREVKSLHIRGESTYESRERAFAYGLIRVVRFVREDGGTEDWVRATSANGRVTAMGDAALAHFATSSIEEIGGVVEARSFLDRDQPLMCPLLPTSQLALMAIGRLRAAQKRADAERLARSKQPLEEPPPASPPPSPDGAASGDATATANLT